VLDRFAGIICACVETLHDVCRSDSDSSLQIEYEYMLWMSTVADAVLREGVALRPSGVVMHPDLFVDIGTI